MKKTTTADADSGSAASYNRLNKSTLPRLSYSQCLSRYFITRSGAIRSVECATSEEFADLVHSCKLPARNQRNQQALKSCLAGLDYQQKLDRWYCVCELLQAGGTMNMFATPEAARAAANTQKEKETLEVSTR